MSIKVGKVVSADADVPVVTPWTHITCVCLLLLYILLQNWIFVVN